MIHPQHAKPVGKKVLSQATPPEEDMLRMDQIHVIRHKLEIEKKSAREVALELGRSRNTIRKYAAGPPERAAYPARTKPVLEQVKPRIEALLAEWKTQTASKQRITATAVHAQPVAEGYSVGTTTVRGLHPGAETAQPGGLRPARVAARRCRSGRLLRGEHHRRR